METGKIREVNVRGLAERNYVEAPANLSECFCPDEHNLHIALSEQHTSSEIFQPDHVGLEGAYCATYGRCKQ